MGMVITFLPKVSGGLEAPLLSLFRKIGFLQWGFTVALHAWMDSWQAIIRLNTDHLMKENRAIHSMSDDEAVQ